MKRTTIAVALAILFLAASGAWWLQGQQTTGDAPPFALTSTGFEDGVQGSPVNFTLDDYHGQVVVLDLMGVTCVSCRIVTDHVLRPIDASYNRSDVVVLSVDVWVGRGGETVEDLIGLQKEENVTWRHALDSDDVLTKYAARELPRVVVIDRDGVIVGNWIGVPSHESVDAVVQAAVVDEASAVSFLTVGILGLALLAGLSSIFTPCSVGLLPAYFGFLLQAGSAQPAANSASTLAAGLDSGAEPRAATGAHSPHTRASPVGRAVLGGLTTAAGIVAVYAFIAVLLLVAGESLRPYVRFLNPIVAVALLGLGIAMFAGFDWEWLTRRIGIAADGRKGFFAFGVGYGTAAFGCTGPVFIPILFQAFLQGPAIGATAFALYTAAVAGLVVLAAVLVASSRETLLRKLLSRTPVITKISAGLMVAAGIYLLWFASRTL